MLRRLGRIVQARHRTAPPMSEVMDRVFRAARSLGSDFKGGPTGLKTLAEQP